MAEAKQGTLDFLLEVRVEEIPARMLQPAIQELATRVFEELMARGLAPGEIETGFTPRRLVLILKELTMEEKDKFVRVVGPAKSIAFASDGTPTKAAEGFAKRLGAGVGQVRVREFSPIADETAVPDDERAAAITASGQDVGKPVKVKAKGEYAYLPVRVAGRKTSEVLAEIVPKVLGGIGWAKTMKWGVNTGPWVRPVHGILALLSGSLVSFEFLGVSSGRASAGHPTLSPEPFEVADLDDYRAKLAARGIVVDPAERRRILAAKMAERAAADGGALVDDPPLLDKLAAICEIPGVLEGSFDPRLTDLPREVLATSLADHQSALTAEKDGRLLPSFYTVMDRPDDPAGRVRAGNEWVVAARLADARFFWEKDRQRTLGSRLGLLADLAFHEKLGSYADKRQRLESLVTGLADYLGLPAEEHLALAEAAGLLKVDLTTDMVREFTSLQGVMGGVYAREEEARESVWQAIYDQYLPVGSDDRLPRGRVGRLAALADRLDTLVGFFSLGMVPTGSRDPFGLRRAALGVARIALEGELDVDLEAASRLAHEGYESGVLKLGFAETWQALGPFFADRVRFLLGQRGFAHDEIEAGLGAEGEPLASLPALAARVAAVRAVREDRDFLAVVLAAKRIANILKGTTPGERDRSRFTFDAERELDAAAERFDGAVERALGAHDFEGGLRAVGPLAAPLEKFFVDVLVMDPDASIRANRLALLAGIHRGVRRLADLSAVVVDKAEYR